MFVFLCYDRCKDGKYATFTYYPSFKLPHQQISLCLQEDFLVAIESGNSINKAAEKVFPNMDYSRKTLQRIKKRLKLLSEAKEQELVQEITEAVPQVSTEGLAHKSHFSFLFSLWQRALEFLPKFKPVPLSLLFFSQLFSRTWLEYQ
jgi:hypothetical protein